MKPITVQCKLCKDLTVLDWLPELQAFEPNRKLEVRDGEYIHLPCQSTVLIFGET